MTCKTWMRTLIGLELTHQCVYFFTISICINACHRHVGDPEAHYHSLIQLRIYICNLLRAGIWIQNPCPPEISSRNEDPPLTAYLRLYRTALSESTCFPTPSTPSLNQFSQDSFIVWSLRHASIPIAISSRYSSS